MHIIKTYLEKCSYKIISFIAILFMYLTDFQKDAELGGVWFELLNFSSS